MNTALLLIDIQTGFDSPFWGVRNNRDAELHAARLLGHWRASNAPVIHIRHISSDPDSPLSANAGGTGFKTEVAPKADERIVEKTVNSAFIGTDLDAYLQETAIGKLVICGLTTPHCVSTTSRMAANLGYEVTLAHEACAAFTRNADSSWADLPPMSAQDIHQSAVSHLHGEFVTARSTSDILTWFPA